MLNPYDELKRELAEVKRELQKLKDDQIKQNRDYKDMIYNLDTDNIPKLQAVVKKVNLVVSEDGNVTAKFIMEVVNNSSNAEISASRILLDGGTVLLGDKIKATSDGKMTMESAEIKSDCILASDIVEGKAMRIGKTFDEKSPDGNGTPHTSYSEMSVFHEDESLFLARSLEIGTTCERSSAVSDGVKLTSKLIEGARHIELESYADGNGYDYCAVGIQRDGQQGESGVAYLRAGDTYLWVDREGVYTNASEIITDMPFPF